jgi:CRP-like cAMP-binding protein
MRPQRAQANSHPSPDPVLRRLRALGQLSASEAELVQRQWEARELYKRNEKLVREGQVVRPQIIASGWVAKTRTLQDGRRQIIDVGVAGDSLAPNPARERSPYDVISLTDVEILDLDPLLAPPSAHVPGLRLASAQIALEAEERLFGGIVRLGRLSALERLAHFLLEMHDRLSRVGLVQGAVFQMPLNQDQLADLLGLSAVHINRVTQQLRREGLIELRSGAVVLLERERLTGLATGRFG